jgi:hypothetical protein
VVDSTLLAVLARPEFGAPPRRPLMEAIARSLSWVWDRVTGFLRWLLPDAAGGEAVWAAAGRTLLVLLAAVSLVLVARAVLPLLGRRRPAGGGAEAAMAAAGPRTAEAWEAKARHAAEGGSWRDAAVALYQAVLHRLAQAEHVRLDPAKTPGEYRREVRGRPDVEAAFAAFVRRFEPVAFGGGVADRPMWEGLRDLAAGLGARA